MLQPTCLSPRDVTKRPFSLKFELWNGNALACFKGEVRCVSCKFEKRFVEEKAMFVRVILFLPLNTVANIHA
jgi:hypothetical protein